MIATWLVLACAPRLPPVPSVYMKTCFRVYHEVGPGLSQAEVMMCGDESGRYWLERTTFLRPSVRRLIPCDPSEGEVCESELWAAQRRAR